MAELHILGQIHGAIQFSENYSLFCRYTFQAGPNWTLISGCSEGQTASGHPNTDKSIVWAHPLDLHYVTKGIQGWPKVLVQVNCLDSLGRTWVLGYGCSSLPAVPGYHSVNIPCWVPAATSISDKIRQYFLGGSHQLSQTDIITLGSDRFKLNTHSRGYVKLSICNILRNFSKFGVEYK